MPAALVAIALYLALGALVAATLDRLLDEYGAGDVALTVALWPLAVILFVFGIALGVVWYVVLRRRNGDDE